MTNDELNKKIHAWRGLCWHESSTDTPGNRLAHYTCRHCLVKKVGWDNPDYCVDGNAMLELIECVRKWSEGETHIEIIQYRRFYWVEIERLCEAVGDAQADTLPLAVAMAVGQLIDREKGDKNGKDN